jgi:hypothetical protein
MMEKGKGMDGYPGMGGLKVKFKEIVKLYCPAVVGVPLTRPFANSESPGGRLPLLTENE